MKMQKARIIKALLKKNSNKTGGPILSDTKNLYKTIVIKIV